MPRRAVRLVLGPQNAPTVLAAGTPSLFAALVGIAVLRVAYGIDALLEGSPTLTVTGGPVFSALYAVAWLIAATWALVGTVLTMATGRTRQEFLGLLLALGGTTTLVLALVWNAVHGAPHGLVGIWQPLALAWLSGWRLLNIAGSYRPLPGSQPLSFRLKRGRRAL